MLDDLREFLSVCESKDELKRIRAEVDPHLELGTISKLNDQRNGPSLLFENVKGYRMPVYTGAFTKVSRLAMGLGMKDDSTIFDMAQKWLELVERGKKISPQKVNGGPVLENKIEGEKINLYDFPAPHWFPKDGGRYFGTAAYLITKDPETGFVNLGLYRMQILDKKSLAALILQGKDADVMLKKYRQRGELMPVAAVIGGDPILFILGAAPLPYGVSEYDVAGAFRQHPIEVIESDLTGLPIPATAEIVVEGYMETDPDKFRDEGPFGEYTGYYSSGVRKASWTDVKRILHRDDPIFWGATVGRPITEDTMTMALTKTATLWSELENMKIPGIKSVYFVPSACGRFWVVISIKQAYPGHARQAGLAAFASVTGNYGVKGAIIVDDDIRADDLNGVWSAVRPDITLLKEPT